MAEIDALLQENRQFPAPDTFRQQATLNDPAIYERAAKDPEAFWATVAREIDWIEPWHTVLEWTPPYAKWFVGGKLNASVNCIDRHIGTPRRNKAALIWEGDDGEEPHGPQEPEGGDGDDDQAPRPGGSQVEPPRHLRAAEVGGPGGERRFGAALGSPLGPLRDDAVGETVILAGEGGEEASSTRLHLGLAGLVG